jgi:hypothetical protein
MQKVEGSSPFSRLKAPHMRGFLVVRLPAALLSLCRRSRIRTRPAAAGIPLICWPSKISGVRNRDQTAELLSRFRIRSGNSGRKGLAATRRAGHNDPAGDLQDLGRTLALFLSDEDRRSFTLTARNCINCPSSWASSTQQRAARLSDSSSSKATASAHSLALLPKPNACRNSANPPVGGDAQTAPIRALLAPPEMLVTDRKQGLAALLDPAECSRLATPRQVA